MAGTAFRLDRKDLLFSKTVIRAGGRSHDEPGTEFRGQSLSGGHIVAILLVLSVIAIAVFVYAQGGTINGKPLYRWMLREDGPVETLTAVLLGLAALFALIASFRVPVMLRWARPFLILFCVFSALMALEETSWGERLFDIEPDRVLPGA